MPTTMLKNTLYQMALPLKAPRLERRPELNIQGELQSREQYVHLLRKHHVLGSSLLLSQGDSRVAVFCSSRNPAHPISEASLFRVASITKLVTALAALSAVEEGRLSLNAPVSEFLPKEADIPILRGVSLHHLLSHTSGLTDPPGMEKALEEGKTFPELISGMPLSAHSGSSFENSSAASSIPSNGKGPSPSASAFISAGTSSDDSSRFHYSNLGFGLVGCLLESVYDQPVSQIVDRLVFQPLHMRATLDGSTLNLSEIVPITRVLPYRPGHDLRLTPLGSRPLTSPDPLRHYGHTAGAMYTDAASLEKLLICLKQKGQPILSSALGSLMAEKQSSYGAISPTLSYGYGMLIIQDASLSSSRILGHQGFAYGCADGAFWEEDSGRIVIFLNGGASEARHGRLGICNEEILRWALCQEMPRWS